MKTYIRLFVVLTTIFLASLITALSCDKKDATAGNPVTNVTNITNMITNVTNTNISNISNTNITNISNTNQTNIYKNPPTPPRVAAAAGLENFVITPNARFAKIEGGAIYINATALANAVGPAISDSDASDRGAGDVADVADGGGADAVNVPRIFTISIRNATGGIMLLQPSTVTRDTLSYATGATTSGYPSELETAPITTATYRTYNLLTDTGPYVWNVFNNFANTDGNGAQGVFYCRGHLTDSGIGNPNGPLTGGETLVCRFASVNNGVSAAAEVNEAWVAVATTTKTLDVKLFGIDTGNKTIPNLGAPSITSGIAFGNPINNATMKQIMNANTYYESELTIRIVSAADY